MQDEKEIMNNNEELEPDDGVIQLINEDGDALDFFFVASLEYKGDWYAFFQPAEEMEDIEEDEIVVFRVVQNEDGEDTFEPVEDEKLLDEVYDEYVKMHQEYLEENGCDCGCHDDHDCDCGCHDGHDCDCDDDCDCGCEDDCDDDCDCGCHEGKECHCHDDIVVEEIIECECDKK